MLTLEQQDIFKEITNIGVGKAANLLNTIINKHINLELPEIKQISTSNIIEVLEVPNISKYSSISMKFHGDISGISTLLFSSIDANLLVNTFVSKNEIEDDLDSLKSGVLNEIGNIVLNSLVGSISNFINKNFIYDVPIYKEGILDNVFIDEFNTSELLVAKTKFNIEKLEISGQFILLLDKKSLDKLISLISQNINGLFEN